MGQSFTKRSRKYSNSHPVSDVAMDYEANKLDGETVGVLQTTDCVQSSTPFVECGRFLPPRVAEDSEEYRAPDILFFFDRNLKRICIFDCNTRRWTNNDVREACFVNEAEIEIVDKKLLIEEIAAEFQNYSMIAINGHMIHIVGKYHMVYDISQHKLTLKTVLFPEIDNPCLCFNNLFVFSLSGRKDNEYTTLCKFYNIGSGKWSNLPELPHPHAYGSAICFNDNKNDTKLMIAGGFQRRIPVFYNQKISLMDMKEQIWSTKVFTANKGIPVFLEAPMIQSHEGSIFILGSRDGGYYKVDLKKNKYVFTGQMIGQDARNKRKSVSCSLNSKNEVFFLADPRVLHKNLHNKQAVSKASELVSPLIASPKLDQDATYCIAHFKLGSDPYSLFLADFDRLN